mmetsp:Transcript_60724/g.140247  ORF Transcript_60724/g.140247 Transcript_60724/m.140247 type:complete len:167 (+) Transcript_60724:2169-2669(+)
MCRMGGMQRGWQCTQGLLPTATLQCIRITTHLEADVNGFSPAHFGYKSLSDLLEAQSELEVDRPRCALIRTKPGCPDPPAGSAAAVLHEVVAQLTSLDGDGGWLRASFLGPSLMRLVPSFAYQYYGCRNLREMLAAAQDYCEVRDMLTAARVRIKPIGVVEVPSAG